MLRQLFKELADRQKQSSFVHDEKYLPNHTSLRHSTESLSNIKHSLSEDQKTIIGDILQGTYPQQPVPVEMKEYKTFNAALYQILYPYLALAYSFEKNGIIANHTKKLACVFKNVNEALNYLILYGNHHPNNKQFIHDACLFSLPEHSSPHIKQWLKLAENSKNLLEAKFLILLSNTASIDAQIIRDKAEQKTLLLNVLNHHGEIKAEIDTITEKQCAIVQKKLDQMIRERSQFCRHYAARHHDMSRDEKNMLKNIQYLKDLPELYSDRAILHVRKKIGQYGVNDFYDVYQRLLKLTDSTTEPEKKFFITHGIAEKYYAIFKTLNRSQAGKNIPDIGILACDKEFYLKKLIVSKPEEAALAACLGKLTNCCQSLSGESGQPCTIHGLTHPDSGFYVLFKGDSNNPKITDTVWGQTWVNRTASGALLFDSIESKQGMEDKKACDIVKTAFQRLANDLIQLPDVPAVRCGANSGISEEMIEDVVRYAFHGEPPKEYYQYRDSYQQYLLADKRLLGTLGEGNNFKINVKAFGLALMKDKNKLSADICFTIGYLIKNKKQVHRLSNLFHKSHRKRLQKYIKLQTDFIEQCENYLENPAMKEKTLAQYIKGKSIDSNILFKKNTILIHAAMNNHVMLFTALLKSKADLNLPNLHNKTALMCAANKNHKDILKNLLHAKAVVNFQARGGDTALIHAATKGHVAIVNILLKAKAVVDIADEKGRTALTYAAREDHVDVVKVLLEAKAAVDSPDKVRCVALIYAAKNAHIKVVKVLLEAKAATHFQDIWGNTAIICAAERNNIDFIKILLEAKAAVNIRNNAGKTALIVAAGYGHNDIVNVLLAAKADLTIEDHDGRTALTWARESNHAKCTRTLITAIEKLPLKSKCFSLTQRFFKSLGLELVVIERKESALQNTSHKTIEQR